jgi:hypothetical protein
MDPASGPAHMRRLPRLGLALLLASAAATAVGCAAADDSSDEVNEVEGDATSDGSSELYLRTGETSLWMNQALTRRVGEHGGEELVMRGRTSRNIEDGRGFIFDDVFGDFFIKSPRTFEVVFGVQSSRGLTDGVPQFIQMWFVHSNGRPDSLTARAIVRPRLVSFSGTSKLYFTAELTPVVVGGRVVYRIFGHTTGTTTTSVVTARVGDNQLTGVRVFDDHKKFEIDLDPDLAWQVMGGTTELEFTAYTGAGTVTKKARLGAWIKKLGLTAADIETVWPPITCASSTRTCLQSQPDGTIDLAACGEAVAVNACAGEVGVFVTGDAFSAALAAAGAELATPQWRQDATGIIGADRLEEYQYIAEQIINSKLEGMFGRWYLSMATRDAALAKAVADGFASAHARPLDYFEPRSPAPGDVAATRQLVADAVLAHVGAQDLTVTEWARTMEELVTEFRAWHVASLRNFRETVSPEPWPSHPEWDLYVGDWLGAYVEVTVLKSTGEVVNVLLEID